MTMKTKDIIKLTLNETPKTCEFIPSGLTNNNYHITSPSFNVVLRIPHEKNAHLFDYHHEEKVLELIKDLNLDTPLISFDPTTGIKVSQYIEHSETLSPVHYQDAMKLIIHLHKAEIKSHKTYNILEQYKAYAHKNTLHNLKPFEHYLQEAHQMYDDVRLCHNDLVSGNFLFTNTQSFLIDYEYAMDNDPYFDLLSFITENDIQDETIRQDLFAQYFEAMNIVCKPYKLLVFEAALHVLWCSWAIMMYENHNEQIFKDIADLKFKRLLEVDSKLRPYK